MPLNAAVRAFILSGWYFLTNDVDAFWVTLPTIKNTLGPQEASLVLSFRPTGRTNTSNTSRQYGRRNYQCYTGRRSKMSKLSDNNDNDDTNDKDQQNQLSLFPQFLSDRYNLANPLEIRLDATLASCYVLCRFLIFDILTSTKERPGWEVHDIIMLLQTFSSAILLSFLWTTVGIITGNFEVKDVGYSSGETRQDLDKTVATASVAAPIWVLTEALLGWPPAGVDYYSNGMDLATIVASGSIGLCSIMVLGKVFTSGWR